MTIKYKFNKSSEARDCVVESVELETIRKNETVIDLKTVCKILDEYENGSLLEETFTTEGVLCYFNDERFDNIEDKITYEASYGNTHRVKGEYNFNNKVLFVTLEYLYQAGQRSFNCELIESYIRDTTIKTKQFTSPQQLKDYINTIQEPIEFIAESSIDDVLMKEWIGEWKIKSESFTEYKNEDGYDIPVTIWKNIKTGSPKLNSNWTFKIE